MDLRGLLHRNSGQLQLERRADVRPRLGRRKGDGVTEDGIVGRCLGSSTKGTARIVLRRRKHGVFCRLEKDDSGDVHENVVYVRSAKLAVVVQLFRFGLYRDSL